MSQSAAEKIIIDDDVLIDQVRTLTEASGLITTAAEPATKPISASGFGMLCSFLVAPMNAMAGRVAETAEEAAVLAERMSDRLTDARKEFTQYEEQTANALDRFEVGP